MTTDSKRPQGGFVTRMMPPTDWSAGQVPAACYDPKLHKDEIQDLLAAEYLKPENRQRLEAWLAERDGGVKPEHHIVAELQLGVLAEIDAGTVWGFNWAKAENSNIRG
jgi:hypothetical protein